jgi:hypothetical protein
MSKDDFEISFSVMWLALGAFAIYAALNPPRNP